MTDIETARRVLALSADDDGLSAEDIRTLRTELSLSEKQVSSLCHVLSDRYISSDERAMLGAPRLFSRVFVTSLAGRDGMEPLRRRVDLLMDRAGSESLAPRVRRVALGELRELIDRSRASPERERWVRSSAALIVDRMTSLVRTSREPQVRQEALWVLSSMTAPYRPQSYLTRSLTLRAMEVLGEAIVDPDRGVREAAVLNAGYLYQAWPHDLPEGVVAPLEAWKRRCRPVLEGVLQTGVGDSDTNIRSLARDILEMIFIGRE